MSLERCQHVHRGATFNQLVRVHKRLQCNGYFLALVGLHLQSRYFLVGFDVDDPIPGVTAISDNRLGLEATIKSNFAQGLTIQAARATREVLQADARRRGVLLGFRDGLYAERIFRFRVDDVQGQVKVKGEELAKRINFLCNECTYAMISLSQRPITPCSFAGTVAPFPISF